MLSQGLVKNCWFWDAIVYGRPLTIYLRSCQDILSLFIDSRIISGPAFAHCSNPSQTNISIERSIFAQEHLKISSRSISCCNCFDWTLKTSRAGVSFPRLISMIGVTTYNLLKKFWFEKCIMNLQYYKTILIPIPSWSMTVNSTRLLIKFWFEKILFAWF